MWIEVTALRYMEGRLLGEYATIAPGRLLTDLVHSPEAKGRIDDATKDFYLERVGEFISEVALLRVVLLSAAFEVFFDTFVDEYLDGRAKYSVGGARTADGNKVAGEVRKTRGIVPRVEAFCDWTGANTKSIQPHLDVLSDVYTLRNVLAHRAGICDAVAAKSMKTLSFASGDRLRLTPEQLVRTLAPSCITLAENLDKRI